MSFVENVRKLQIEDAQALVEKARELHFAVATSEDNAISWCRGEVYPHSEAMFKALIQVAYPNLDSEYIYEAWQDSNESIAYCVNHLDSLD